MNSPTTTTIGVWPEQRGFICCSPWQTALNTEVWLWNPGPHDIFDLRNNTTSKSILLCLFICISRLRCLVSFCHLLFYPLWTLIASWESDGAYPRTRQDTYSTNTPFILTHTQGQLRVSNRLRHACFWTKGGNWSTWRKPTQGRTCILQTERPEVGLEFEPRSLQLLSTNPFDLIWHFTARTCLKAVTLGCDASD